VRRVEPEHADLAGAAGAVALEDLGDRGLAGAVGAEEAEDLTGGDGERDAAHGLQVAVGAPQVVNVDGVVHGDDPAAGPAGAVVARVLTSP
jgi:hypothetical protein